MTKCKGCGIDLQCINSSKLGYVRKDKIDTSEYCENCFKIIHYGKNSVSSKTPRMSIIKDINKKNIPVIYMIDILNINNDSIKYLKQLTKRKKYILLSKIDLLPKSVKENKLIKFFKDNFSIDDEVICISSKKDHNIKKIFNMLKKDLVEKVYVIGLTNAGKSSFINSLMSINDMSPTITTSPVTNTTYSYLNITIGGIEFIDTPGFENNTIHNYLSRENMKLINPTNQLKVKTFQIKSGYSIIINDLVRLDYIKGHLNSFNFYMNNNLSYKKVKSINNKDLMLLPNKTFELNGKKDIVINGLGFIKVNKPGILRIYSLSDDVINIRNKMI